MLEVFIIDEWRLKANELVLNNLEKKKPHPTQKTCGLSKIDSL